jgi:hypothetical protein
MTMLTLPHMAQLGGQFGNVDPNGKTKESDTNVYINRTGPLLEQFVTDEVIISYYGPGSRSLPQL